MPRDVVDATHSRHVALSQKLLDLVLRFHELSRLDAHLVGLDFSLRIVATSPSLPNTSNELR